MIDIDTPYGHLVWGGKNPPTEDDTVLLDGEPVMLGGLISHTHGDIIQYLPASGTLGA